jgi:hypothetical protein
MPEKTDVSARGLAIGAGIVIGGIAASLVGAALVTKLVQAPATGPSAGREPAIAGAVLQTAPRQDLVAFRREKNARLAGTGPVDADHVHIPIERAMQILARGRER